MRTIVVIPTYCEAGNMETVLRALASHVPGVEVLVVDDNSPDGTAEVVEKLAAELAGVEVLRRPGKGGLGAAYRAGFARALEMGAEACAQMDADMSHDPADLPALLSAVEAGADASIGSRYIPGGSIENWPSLRRWLSRWGNRYAAGMLGLAVNDATSGFRVYRADALRLMDVAGVTADGYGFQVEMTHRIVKRGGKVVEVPITFRDRTVGDSKLSHNIISEAFVIVARLAVADLRRGRRRRRFGR